jgi:proteic killer suppression protein
MIKSFKDTNAGAIFEGRKPGKGFPPDLIRAARRKLIMIHAARTLDDLRSPPNNRLEKLERDRKGQHSIRINDQFRICFVWTGVDADNVEITDYH